MAVESLLANIAGKLLGEIASQLLLPEILGVWYLKSNLRELQSSLTSVKAEILDMEERQFTSHGACNWLGQLKNVLFDAEDVLEEFAYAALKKKLVNSPTHGSISKKVRRLISTSSNPVVFRFKMHHKLKKIREALDRVAANRANFNPSTHHMISNNSTLFVPERQLTHSFVESSKIIGRDGDRDTVLTSLMDSESPKESVSVVSIVGMGGLGKTALAKLLFNHERVAGRFKNNKFWVCLGDLKEFDVNQVMARVVESITGVKSADSNPEVLQKCLRDNLCKKEFLLVFDDVWAVSRANWEEFKDLLMCGAKGSKVLVTTRHPLKASNKGSVASNMGSILTHSLQGLPPNDCVSLFKKFAFKEGEDDGELMEIGEDIVKKCQGVPLAIRTLGCLLSSKRHRDDWEYVRDSEIWKLEQTKDDILPALKIGYDLLPFTLKQCFLCCSNFPKDHEFFSEELIMYWEALGIIVRSSVTNKKIEDIGQQYINELCARGFFQDFRDCTFTSVFKMHDLIHNLALSVAQSELKHVKGERKGKDMYKSIRHVSFLRAKGMDGENIPTLFLKNKSSSICVMPTFWSVFFNRIRGEGGDIGELIETCVSNLKHLRILDLRRITSLEQLVDSIGALRHLTVLNLGGCRRLKRLPDSICKLYHLQSLYLSMCEDLEELPEDIGDLMNLKRLEVTTKQRRLSQGAGKGIGSLSALQFLYFMDCENLEYIFELWTNETPQPLLTSLKTLTIQRCKSLKSLSPSSPSRRQLRELSDLETLGIEDCPNVNLASLFNDEISLVKLRSLYLFELPQMESLPQWISLTLEVLHIDRCRNLASLPEWLHNLTSLHRLEIENCPKLLCLPDVLRVLQLKELVISGCPELSRRCKRPMGEDWPKIKHIPEIWLDEKLQTKPT